MLRRSIRTAIALCTLLRLTSWPACGDTAIFDANEPPIVRVNLAQGDVTVRTWDRAQVQIDADPGVDTQRRLINVPAEQNIPIFEGRIAGKDGPVILPAEAFVVGTVPKGPHETIGLTGRGNVTLTIPQNTPLLIVQILRGTASLNDVKGGTFIVRVRTGSAILKDVGNDGFVQVMQGTIAASDSSFNRLRARSALASVWFENCHAKQIEVMSVEGRIVFDNGSFEPGLARFESTSGAVALGVNGSANVNAHATDGEVFTLLDRRSSADVRGGDATAAFEGGGPLITASSGSGNIYLYNGTLRNRRDIPPSWTPFMTELRRTVPRPP